MILTRDLRIEQAACLTMNTMGLWSFRPQEDVGVCDPHLCHPRPVRPVAASVGCQQLESSSNKFKQILHDSGRNRSKRSDYGVTSRLELHIKGFSNQNDFGTFRRGVQRAKKKKKKRETHTYIFVLYSFPNCFISTGWYSSC